MIPPTAPLPAIAPLPAAGDGAGSSVGRPGAPPPAQAAAAPALQPGSVLQALLGGLIGQAAARQDGLAPLMADLEALLSTSGRTLPQGLRAAAAEVLALRLSAQADAAQVRAALYGAGAMPQAADAAGLKAALLTLRNVLLSLGAQPDRPAARMPAAPPHRGAPLSPQQPVQPALPPDAGDIAQHLLARTEAALARHTLLQLATLPDMPEAGRPEATRITCEIPLAMPQGSAIAQLRIVRDDEAGNDGDGEADSAGRWRLDIAIDAEPLGRVTARLALSGSRTSVTLLAERAETALQLRESLSLLESGLQAAALEPGDIVCRCGSLPAPPAAPGLFVDRAS